LKNPFECPGSWYKANLHTHTTISDGNVCPAERAAQYREKGYHILALTDHNATNDVSGLSRDGFLVISGMETHPDCPGGDPYHFVCLNVPHGLDLSTEPDPNARIRMVKDAGGEAIIGHPYWCGHNVTHLMPVEGAIGLEIYNGTCTGIGKGFSSVHWDDLLDAGKILPAIAVDDVHHGGDIFMGWTWIRAESLTVEAVMDALRSGCYYASTGPTIEDARMVDGKVSVKCSPASEIQFIAQRSAGRVIRAKDEPLTSAELPFSPMWDYVRIEVIDADGGRAWTNPFVRPV
jgi:hypothetical protein